MSYGESSRCKVGRVDCPAHKRDDDDCCADEAESYFSFHFVTKVNQLDRCAFVLRDDPSSGQLELRLPGPNSEVWDAHVFIAIRHMIWRAFDNPFMITHSFDIIE